MLDIPVLDSFPGVALLRQPLAQVVDGTLGGFPRGALLRQLITQVLEGTLSSFSSSALLDQLFIPDGGLDGFAGGSLHRYTLARLSEGTLCGFPGAPLLAKLPPLIVEGPLGGFLLTLSLRQLLAQVPDSELSSFPGAPRLLDQFTHVPDGTRCIVLGGAFLLEPDPEGGLCHFAGGPLLGHLLPCVLHGLLEGFSRALGLRQLPGQVLARALSGFLP